MKLHTLIIAIALFTIGCSSNDDNPPMNDPGTTAGDDNLTGLDQANTPLQTAVIVASLKLIHELNNFAWDIQTSDRSVEACDDGGTKIFKSRDNGGCTRCQVIVDIDLANCNFEEQSIDGRITLVPLTGGRDRRFSSITYKSQSGMVIKLQGTYSAFPTSTEYQNSFSHTWSIDTLKYAGEDPINVSNLSSTYVTVPSIDDDITRNIIRYESSFEYSGQATNSLDYEFKTINEMIRDPNSPYFDSGVIRVRSDSDTTLDINFGTGDPATLMLILQKESGAEDSNQDVADSLYELNFSISNQI